MQDTVGITIIRGAQSMAFFAFIFSAMFALFNSVLSDYQGWLRNRPQLRSIIRVGVFAALFYFTMKTAWFHNWLSNVVLQWVATENYPPTAELEMGSIGGMIGTSMWTWVFYLFVAALVAAPMVFVRSYWREAKTKGWNWISRDSRDMYVDGAKTLIAASGISVALLASSSVSSVRSENGLVATSAKVAVVCLISCVCVSLITILALLRGFERAQSRYIDEQRQGGIIQLDVGQGKLNTSELLLILIPTAVALSCFLVGFVFLGRIAFHF